MTHHNKASIFYSQRISPISSALLLQSRPYSHSPIHDDESKELLHKERAKYIEKHLSRLVTEGSPGYADEDWYICGSSQIGDKLVDVEAVPDNIKIDIPALKFIFSFTSSDPENIDRPKMAALYEFNRHTEMFDLKEGGNKHYPLECEPLFFDYDPDDDDWWDDDMSDVPLSIAAPSFYNPDIDDVDTDDEDLTEDQIQMRKDEEKRKREDWEAMLVNMRKTIPDHPLWVERDAEEAEIKAAREEQKKRRAKRRAKRAKRKAELEAAEKALAAEMYGSDDDNARYYESDDDDDDYDNDDHKNEYTGDYEDSDLDSEDDQKEERKRKKRKKHKKKKKNRNKSRHESDAKDAEYVENPDAKKDAEAAAEYSDAEDIDPAEIEFDENEEGESEPEDGEITPKQQARIIYSLEQMRADPHARANLYDESDDEEYDPPPELSKARSRWILKYGHMPMHKLTPETYYEGLELDLLELPEEIESLLQQVDQTKHLMRQWGVRPRRDVPASKRYKTKKPQQQLDPTFPSKDQ